MIPAHTHASLAACICQRAAKQQAQEEDRRVRLERLRSENEEEVGRIRADAAESLSTAEKAWEIERGEMERELTEKVSIPAKKKYSSSANTAFRL